MRKLSFLLFASSLMLCFACKKEGCTDSEAANFDEKANTDNNSCLYEGNVSFWFDQNTSDILINWYSVSSITVYINNSLVGTINAADWSVGPDCGGANLTTSWDQGNAKSFTFNYIANDQTGGQQFSGSATMIANGCKSIELAW